MLISKKTNYLKFSFLIIFIIVLFFPVNSINSQNEEITISGWYYGTQSSVPSAAAIPYSIGTNGKYEAKNGYAEEECKQRRKEEILSDYTKKLGETNVDISNCFNLTKKGDINIYISNQDILEKQSSWLNIKDIVEKGQEIEIWWSMYHLKDPKSSDSYYVKAHSSKAACEEFLKNIDELIDIKCSKEKPTKPEFDKFGNIINSSKPTDPKLNYTPLAEIPPFLSGELNLTPNCDSQGKCTPGLGFAGYINILIRIFIGVCAVLAMIMIVMAGVQYMTSGLSSSKQAAKQTMTSAILGLILALGAWAILNTINPNLLDVSLGNLKKVSIEVGGDDLATSFEPLSVEILNKFGIHCPTKGGQNELPKISESFVGKVTYSQNKRGTASDKTIYLDCSSYVLQVYKCAGLDTKNWYNTATMFPGAIKIENLKGTKINNNYDLKTGDLLGWMSSKENGGSPNESSGHVVMYYGNNQQIEVSIPEDALNIGVKTGRSINFYNNKEQRLKYLIKAQDVGTSSSTSSATTQQEAETFTVTGGKTGYGDAQGSTDPYYMITIKMTTDVKSNIEYKLSTDVSPPIGVPPNKCFLDFCNKSITFSDKTYTIEVTKDQYDNYKNKKVVFNIKKARKELKPLLNQNQLTFN